MDNMKVKIEITEQINKLPLHQEGFTLSNEKGETVCTFSTTVPAGLPYIYINSGKNKGKRFMIESKEMQRVCEILIEADF